MTPARGRRGQRVCQTAGVVAQIAERVGARSAVSTSRAIDEGGHGRIASFAAVKASAARRVLDGVRSIPLGQPRNGPCRVLMALGAGIRNAEPHGVLRCRHADRMIGHARAEADDGPRHVTGHAGDASRSSSMSRVTADIGGDRAVTGRTQPVIRAREFRMSIDVRLMGIGMAGRAGGSAFQKAAALPKPIASFENRRGRRPASTPDPWRCSSARTRERA